MRERISIVVSDAPIDCAAILAAVGTDADGAVVCFIGRARNTSRSRAVRYLEYEVYQSMAEKELSKIAREACERWGLSACVIAHRTGRVAIGEASICIVVASPHRDASYQSSRYVIDTIKKTVPIWKREFYEDGSMWITERS